MAEMEIIAKKAFQIIANFADSFTNQGSINNDVKELWKSGTSLID